MHNIRQLLAKPIFQPFLKKAQCIHRLNQTLQEILTIDLKKQCRIADITSNVLVLQVNNGAWATRLRYQTPQLLKMLKTHKDFSTIESLHWCMNTEKEEPSKLVKSRLTYKQSGIIKNLLLASSQSTRNKKLRHSLEKLAEHIG